METIKLIELTDEYAVYEFYPEDKIERKGVLKFDRITKEPNLLEPGEDPTRRYVFHALHRIEEYDRDNNFKNHDLIAWC